MRSKVQKLFEDLRQNDHKRITLYSIPSCPACQKFKNKLNKLDIVYEEVNMNDNEDMWDKLEEAGGSDFVPQIMVEQKLITDYDDIPELLSKTVSEIVERKIVIK